MQNLKYCLLTVLLYLNLSACIMSDSSHDAEQVNSQIILGPSGQAGEHTAVYQDTEGNVYGYYEYLPNEFTENSDEIALIFYWNGSNAITGNGQEELKKLLTQGLPQLINQGQDFSTIIISAMMTDWKTADVSPFVDYIFRRYRGHYDPDRVYMTGFSAGGGLTIRYATVHSDNLAAIVPIAPAIRSPKLWQPNHSMASLPSWFFHNRADEVVEVWRSEVWHQALVEKGGEHKITLYEKEGHYAWQDTYKNPELWHWLLSKSKSRDKAKPHSEES